MWGSNGENQLPQIKELELQQPHPIPHIHLQVPHIKHLIGSNYHLVWGAENILRRRHKGATVRAPTTAFISNTAPPPSLESRDRPSMDCGK